MGTHTSQAWYRRGQATLLALILFGVTLGGGNAGAADRRPDLQLGWNGSSGIIDGWSYAMGEESGLVTYVFFVLNDGYLGEWDDVNRRWLVPPYGGSASNIVVQVTLPAAVTFVAATADSNFTCTHSQRVVTCSGGYLANTAEALLRITVQLPAVASCTIDPVPMVVDPTNAIIERNNANNTVLGFMGCFWIN